MRRNVGALGVVIAIGSTLALAGCITPSIPIPPPDPSQMTFRLSPSETAPTATFSYPATARYEGAVVFLYNRDRGTGIIQAANADGSFGPTNPVAGAVGDQMNITFQLDDESVSTCIRLRDGTQSSTDYCDQ